MGKAPRLYFIPRIVFALACKLPFLNRALSGLVGDLIIDGSRFDTTFGYEPKYDLRAEIERAARAYVSAADQSHAGPGTGSRIVKRAFDLAASIVGLILLSPVLCVLIIMIRLDSSGPGIFSQVRTGRNERPFICHKLRTMQVNTAQGPSHEVGAAMITRVGRFLRRSKLDELPQLWNIVKGEMSFVGPRPCLTTQHELIAARRRHGVFKLRPGITGIAQVQGVDMSNPERLATLDASYLKKAALITDIRLILATVMGAGRGDRAV